VVVGPVCELDCVLLCGGLFSYAKRTITLAVFSEMVA
jgi:hypothetical protein